MEKLITRVSRGGAGGGVGGANGQHGGITGARDEDRNMSGHQIQAIWSADVVVVTGEDR